jgi:hypothetical protein
MTMTIGSVSTMEFISLSETNTIGYIGDEHMALVSWEGTALVCDEVDSAEQALGQVLHDWDR